MAKNIIIIILCLLLVASIGINFYFFQINADIGKIYQDKIKELESSKKDLTGTIEESFLYIQALDLIMEPSRQEFGLDTKKEIDQAEWLRNLSDAADKTGDVKLQNIFKKIITGASEGVAGATVEFVDYTIKTISNYLRIK
ncbi:hypothetical protein KKE19_00270 [Patescibacteria group bacterium]|nr:hypothetical protein [Patescibacteria group bacterium]MBU4367335.1 hypothetical protein [Patescibacteria group bacterium]MBU4461672.1 hypothetical protein [Patescibacteria group bacterium]MCG2699723.1 hypothetical protein [Candidatus Parcubacteria bacterium]